MPPWLGGAYWHLYYFQGASRGRTATPVGHFARLKQLESRGGAKEAKYSPATLWHATTLSHDCRIHGLEL